MSKLTKFISANSRANYLPIFSKLLCEIAHDQQRYALTDLRVPPANRLEKLGGDRAGQWSIRVNDQWRICFEWQESDAYSVEIVDYH